MLLSKNIRRMFAEMYFFKGKVSFNPNTLNNLASTYFLANHWQAINAGKGSSILPASNPDKKYWDNIPDSQRQTYTYQNWEQMIKDAHEFDSDVEKILNEGNQRYFSNVFNDWSVHGDGMALTEYQATAVFNGSQIKQLSDKEKFPLTSKIGGHKSAIADQDTDAQIYSKWFGLQLKLSEQDIVKFEPTSFRNMTDRIKGERGSGAAKADWFFTGKLEKKYTPQNKQTRSRFAQWAGKDLYFRKVQYRYDSSTKLSNVVGYFTASEGSNYHVPNFQNWRKINLINEQTIQYLFMKEVENGYLIDLSNAIMDKNNQDYESEYPQSLEVELFPNQSPTDKLIINLTQSEIQNIFLYQSGMIFMPKETSPFKKLPQKALQAKMKIVFGDGKISFSGVESKYFLCIRDPVVKSSLQQNMIKTQQKYLNETELELCCTSYGKKVCNEDLHVSIKDNQSGAMTNLTRSTKTGIKTNIYSSSALFDEKIQNIFDNPSTNQRKYFVKKYKSLENIKKIFFQNKLEDITSVSETLKQRVQKGNWKSLQSNNVFQLQFDRGVEYSTKTSVRFQNGTARVKVKLNEQLTSKNNPRHQICRSLSMMGKFKVSDKLRESEEVSFNAIFFQTDLHLRKKTDWVSHVGPFLRTMGLMYPAMQKIVDLYNFQSLVMPAMKRAFDIENEDHPRYMPSTRQISPLQHRQVRKWLYEPLFNSDLCIHPKKAFQLSEENIVKIFNEKKKVLVSTLKKAFTLELSTIPLYLSAMFSTNEKSIKNVLRSVSIDEMKHLFIVSNVLNAIHEKQSGPAVPYMDPQHIPSYPTHLVEVLKVINDPQLKEFLKFDIQPYTANQLLKFICIELPAQLNYLELENKVSDPIKKQRIENLKSLLGRIKKQSCENPEFKTIGEVYGEIIDTFWELNDIEKFYREKYCKEKQSEIKLFSGDPRQQFTYFGLENMAEIYDLRSALNQFRLIVSEGEGANLFVCDAQIHKESHFIKFIEIYTGCQVELKVTNPHSDKAKVIFDFVEDKSLVVTDIDNKVWNSKADSSFDAEINKLICSDKVGADGNYADAYAKPAFLNAYQKLLEELDYIFNSDIDKFKEFYAEELVNLSDLDLKRQFEVARRAKMENAIAKMRQMTLHSDHVITPNGTSPNSDTIGSRPSYNVNLTEKKSIKCSSESSEKIK